ncbi:MAG TPA: right-handed parallel beta-helix repeat-containing protein [Bacteroidales bacterium]|nr:right-handed parallel beta-helix repeat-containing protein [Bacteroidales bacterium]
MRKILSILYLLSLPLALNAALNGDGLTSGTAYYGVINSSISWTAGGYPGGVIYVGQTGTGLNDLEVGSGGSLTIGSGITIKFCTTTSDLLITGTGILNASGVTFTKNFLANWGHISFQSMTTTSPEYYPSVIDNCVIEYGNSGTGGYGGGINISFTYVTLSNSIIRYNTGYIGGGITINQTSSGFSPTINNCLVHDNTATYAGGGIMVWNKSAAKIINCIVRNNTCTNTATYGGGGIFIYTTTGAAKIINCTIVNNTSSFNGDNIHFHQVSGLSNNASLINCVVWSSNNNSVYMQGTPIAANFINSAVQRVYDASLNEITIETTFTSSFKINSTNEGSSPSGPYFTKDDGTDWTLQFRSPCRDLGSTPSPTVPNDYIGNPRIGPYDIGAFEVQYSRWKTTPTGDIATWSDPLNWEQGIYPGSGGTGDVVIPPLAGSAVAPNISGTTNIASTKYMILEPGAKATFGTLTNNGTLKLNSTSAGDASLIVDTYTKGGGATEEIQLYLSGGGSAVLGDYKWHYISTPVSSISTDVFTAVTFDLAQFVESRPALSLLQGWVAFDGYVYSTGEYEEEPFYFLTPGKGYNFWDGVNNTFTFGGQLNTADVVMPIPYSNEIPDKFGYNLLGNPFSSGLNWDDIVDGVYFTYPPSTSKGLYFTKDNTQCTYIGGVGTPGGTTGIIPPMQGFFTKTYSTNTITLPAAARTHDAIPARYKGSTIIPLVRLLLKRDSVTSDETVVRFDDAAKSYLDNDFDAPKMFISDTRTLIWSSGDETNYAINGLPFPETLVEIPITINVTKDTIHTISSTQLQGLDDYDVTLRDNLTGLPPTDLKTTPVITFTSGLGTITDRFVLNISTLTTGTESPVHKNNIFNIFTGNGLINIQTIADDWEGKTGSVRVLDLTGKTVSNLLNAEFQKNSLTQVQAPSAKGLYVVEIRAGFMRYVGKVVIK